MRGLLRALLQTHGRIRRFHAQEWRSGRSRLYAGAHFRTTRLDRLPEEARRRASKLRSASMGKHQMNQTYTTSELLSVMCSRVMPDGAIIFAGVGVPLLGATLAQRLHASKLTILFEGGIIGPFIQPGRLPSSTNEMRTAEKANML